jgi:hypothetical protein
MSGSDLCILRNEIVQPRYFQNIYYQDRSAYFAAAKYADRSWEYINRSQIQYECRDCKGGRTVSFLGMHKSDFWYSAVYTRPEASCYACS